MTPKKPPPQIKKKFRSMGRLVGLEGLPASIPGWCASSITEAIHVVRAKRAVTAAGDCGALTVWKQKSGYSVEFNRYRLVVCRNDGRTLAQVRKWLKEWWPQLRTPAQPAPTRERRTN